MPLILGAISATCYGTVAFAPLFLVPVQICGAKKGFRAMLESMLVAALLIAAWQALLLGRAGALGAGAIAMGVSTPAAMLAALALIAARRFEAVPFALRALAGGAIASAACVPAFAVAAADPNVRAMFEAAMGQAVSA